MTSRFWVVGGTYTDTDFSELLSGSERVMGPYPNRDAALVAWRRVAEETRSDFYAALHPWPRNRPSGASGPGKGQGRPRASRGATPTRRHLKRTGSSPV